MISAAGKNTEFGVRGHGRFGPEGFEKLTLNPTRSERTCGTVLKLRRPALVAQALESCVLVHADEVQLRQLRH